MPLDPDKVRVDDIQVAIGYLRHARAEINAIRTSAAEAIRTAELDMNDATQIIAAIWDKHGSQAKSGDMPWYAANMRLRDLIGTDTDKRDER